MEGVLVVESILLPEDLEGADLVREWLGVAEKRQTYASTAIVDRSGLVITDEGYEDRAVTIAPDGLNASFVRSILAESTGAIGGSSWARSDAADLAYRSGSPFRWLPATWMVHSDDPGRPGRPRPVATDLSPLAIAYHPDARRLAVSSLVTGNSLSDPEAVFRVREIALDSGSATDCVFSCGIAPRRVRYGGDGDHILVIDREGRRSAILALRTKRLVALPLRSAAVDWHPTRPSTLRSIGRVAANRAELVEFDVRTWSTSTLGVFEQPGRVDFTDLAMHPDGRRALARTPIIANADEQARRGGLYVAALLDLEAMGVEPILPTRIAGSRAERVHAQAEWIAPRALPTKVVIAEHAMRDAAPANLETVPRPRDVEARRRGAAQHRQRLAACRSLGHIADEAFVEESEVFDEIASAGSRDDDGVWHGRRFFDANANLRALRRVVGLDQHLRTDRAEDAHHIRQTGSLIYRPRSGTRADWRSDLAAPLRRALETLVAAPDSDVASAAAQELAALVDGAERGVWLSLVGLQSETSNLDGVLIALATQLWCAEYVEMFPPLVGIMEVPVPIVEAQLLNNGITGCLLIGDDDAFVASGRQRPYDVGEVLARCIRQVSILEERWGSWTDVG